MSSPAFIDASPYVEDPTYAWPSTLTVTSSDVPAGVATGDRLLLLVPAITSNAPSFHHFHVTHPEWTTVTSVGQPGAGSPYLAVFTARNTAAAFPVTIESHTISHTLLADHVGDIYRRWGAVIAAWSPSSTITTSQIGSASGTTPIPSVNLTTPTFAADGVAIAVALLSGGFYGAHTVNGFTEQGDRSPTWHAGYPATLKIADKAMTAGSGTSGIRWSHTPAGSTAGYVLLTLDDPDPPIVTPGGWSVGMIQW
jgi:hypothetical protein